MSPFTAVHIGVKEEHDNDLSPLLSSLEWSRVLYYPTQLLCGPIVYLQLNGSSGQGLRGANVHVSMASAYQSELI